MKFLAPFLLIFVVSCANIPETPNERYAAAEIAYQAAVQTSIDLAEQGIIKSGSDEAIIIVDTIITTRSALDSWSVLIGDSSRMTKALTALKALQGIIDIVQARVSS